MPGKGRPPQAIPSPISRHIITCYVQYQGPKHTVIYIYIYILVQTVISVQAKLEVVRRKHIVHLTGFGAYSSTWLFWMDCVAFTNIDIKYGSSAAIEQLKQRVEQHCYKVPYVASIRKCHSISTDYAVCVVIPPNTNPWYHMNELTPEFLSTICFSLHSIPLIL